MQRIVTFILLVITTVFSQAQDYGFLLESQEYKLDQFDQNVGLNNPFINTINQSDNGKLLVGTSEGVGIFDGKNFEMYYTDDHLAENYISSSFKDDVGNIWYGHQDGGVSIFDGVSFDLVHPGGGINSVINDIDQDQNGLIWFAAKDFGLFNVNEKGKCEFFNNQFEEQQIYSFKITSDGYFFVGTDVGVDVYKYYKEEKILSKVQGISGVTGDQVAGIVEMESGKIVVSTFTSGLYLIEKKSDVFLTSKIKFSNFEDDILIRDVKQFGDAIWISTLQSGLLKCKWNNKDLLVLESYHSTSGLRTDAVNTMFIDREGILWIGTFGEGLASKGDNLFTFYFANPKGFYKVNRVIANDTEVWVANKGVVSVRDKQTLKELKHFNEENGLPLDGISAMHFTEDSTLFIGTEYSGIYRYVSESNSFNQILLSGDDLSLTITSLTSRGNQLWIGTLNGVYKMNIETEGIVSYDVSSGLSHNSVGDVLITKSGDVFIGTRSAFLNKFNDGVFEKIKLTPEYDIVTVNKLIESSDGAIWISTSDNGVFRVDENILSISVLDGLASNYCYGIEQDINGRIWVMHNGGLSRVVFDIESNGFRIELYGAKHGMSKRFLRNSISKFNEQLWFGSENGAVLYNANEDKQNRVPPITSFAGIKINEIEYDLNEDIILPYGEYDVFIDFKGISLKKSEMVTYQFLLEGHQSKWSEKSAINLAKYHKVYDGEYTFMVRSYNSDGVVGDTIAIKISIAKPFWKEWWFIIALGVAFIFIVAFIVKMRERSHLLYQKELELQLALRTKEVVLQKEEIEDINKDITDSINYAKRIQTAILPQEEEFLKLFPKSFVVYKPKDIVSGDFYWARKFNNLHLIVCADCTGHGVPGAFMSMIGMMLLYESCVLKNILDPGEILQDIDNSLKEILRQNDDFESNKDGMDLSICIIDIDSNKMYTAGAMRPIYIYRNSMQHIIKGDRFSLGGTIIKNKVFNTREYDLMKDDLVYMFSDGYADQFGGPSKRKMKVQRLNELLDQVSQLDISKQAKEIDAFFENWKGDTPQMDDVLLIGFQY
jgi:ligand-binding sensor domain-containing protein/serine phosphatase RsbU (regulator of sigma subunit)